MVDGSALALHARQVGGQPGVVARIDQQRQLPVEQVGQVGDGILHAVHRERDMAAVEVPAMQHALALGVDDRIVVGAIEFILDRGAKERQRVGQHADHMRRAADRIAVLQALAVALLLAGVGQIGAQPGGHILHARMRLDREQRFVEVMGVAVQRERGHRRDARGEARQVGGAVPGQAGQARHDGGAIHDRQALFRPQAQRRDAGLAQRIGSRHLDATAQHFTFTAQHRREIGQRRQVAAGADRAFAGDQRQQVGIKQAHDLLEQIDADARKAFRQ